MLLQNEQLLIVLDENEIQRWKKYVIGEGMCEKSLTTCDKILLVSIKLCVPLGQVVSLLEMKDQLS